MIRHTEQVTLRPKGEKRKRENGDQSVINERTSGEVDTGREENVLREEEVDNGVKQICEGTESCKVGKIEGNTMEGT